MSRWIDEIKETAAKLMSSHKPIAGIVVSTQAKHHLETHARDNEGVFNDESYLFPEGRFLGVQIYSFPDVEDDKSIVFYDREKLVKYLELREEGKSHTHALAEMLCDSFKVQGFSDDSLESLDPLTPKPIIQVYLGT